MGRAKGFYVEKIWSRTHRLLTTLSKKEGVSRSAVIEKAVKMYAKQTLWEESAGTNTPRPRDGAGELVGSEQ